MGSPSEVVGEGSVIPHHKLFETEVGAAIEARGSKAFHLDDVPELVSVHDGRRKKVLFNSASTAADLRVDVVSVVPGGSSPLHYHRGTDHFFFILDGRGRIVIEDRSYPLRAGTVVWIADGDPHQVFADPESPLTFLEYFSRGQHETVFLGQGCEWRPTQR